MMNKIAKITIIAAVIALGIFIYLKKSNHYLQGDPILLVDQLKEENVQYAGLRTRSVENQTYSLNGSWKAIEQRGDKTSLWTTTMPAAIRPGTEVKLLYKGTPVQKSDALQKQTTLPSWNIFNDQIWIARDSNQPAGQSDYVLKYKPATTRESSQILSRKLTSEDLVCVTGTAEGQRNIFFVSLPDDAKNNQGSTTLKMSVEGSGLKTEYAPGILNDFHRTERIISLYTAEEPGKVLTLQEREAWGRILKIPAGKWILHLITRSSSKKEPPVLQITVNDHPVSSFIIANQEWKSFYLAFETEQKRNKIEITTSSSSKRSDSPVILIQDLSMWRSGPGTVNGRGETPERRLEDPVIRWEQTDLWKSNIYEPPNETALITSNPRPIWTKTRYFLPGPVSIQITARSEEENGTPVRLGVYLGKRQLGKLAIAGPNPQQYTVQTFTSGGWGAIKLVPEPGKDDMTGPLFIQEVSIHHHPGILVSAPVINDSNPDFTARFRTDIPTGADALRAAILRHPLGDPMPGALTCKKEVEGDTRNSFLLQSHIRIRFPVQLQQGPVLKFSVNAERRKCRSSKNAAELVIRSQPAWGLHKTLFRKPMNTSNKWINHQIPLDPYSNEKTILTFEMRDSVGSECPVDVWIGNPYIASRQTKKKPRTVILFSADALRADHLGSYGYSRNTSPGIDQFSKESVLFENAISQAPWTLPSISSLLTSLYPSFHGAYYRESKLQSTYTLLPEILKNKKFLTAGFTKNGFLNRHRGFVQGFDSYQAATAESTGEERLNQIFTWLEQNSGQDLFLLVHFLEPHFPYEAPEEYVRKFAGPGRKNLDTSTENLIQLNENGVQLNPEDLDYLMSLYDAEIAYLDSIFVRFRRKLQELNRYESALLVFLSDHGEEFQDHGKLMHTARLYQELIHVPLIIKFPVESGISAKRISSPVALVDVMPTVLDALNLQPEAAIHGRSLLPLSRKKDESPRVIFTERNDVRMLGIIDGSFKYIYSSRTSKEEIYDLENDPHEKVNLSVSRADLLKIFQKRRADFLAHVTNYEKNKKSNGTVTVTISEEDEKSLRALGYVQ